MSSRDDISRKTFSMPALGRHFNLGTVYDAVRDETIPGFTFWNGSVFKNIETTRNAYTEFSIIASDKLTDKFQELKDNGSLQVSILSGMIKLSGSANYFDKTKSTSRQSSVHVKLKCLTAVKKLIMEHLAESNLCYPQIQRSGMIGSATHLVTQIQYGAEGTFTFTKKLSETEDELEVNGKLKLGVEKFTKFLKGNANVGSSWTDSNQKNEDNIECHFQGDFELPSNVDRPTTFNEAIVFVQKFLKFSSDWMAKDHANGNQPLGVPITVWLYPLVLMQDAQGAPALRYEISLTLASQCVGIMENYGQVEDELRFILEDPLVKMLSPLQKKLQLFQRCLRSFIAELKIKLAGMVVGIRSGKIKVEDFSELMSRISNEQFTFNSNRLKRWLDQKHKELCIIRRFQDEAKNKLGNQSLKVHFTPSGTTLQEEMTKFPVYCFEFSLASLAFSEPFWELLNETLGTNYVNENSLPKNNENVINPSWLIDAAPDYNLLDIRVTIGEEIKGLGQDIYPNRHISPRGLALIMNFEKFNGNIVEQRIGSEKDVIHLDQLLQQLGYKVIIKSDLTLMEMNDELESFTKSEDHIVADSVIVAVMSHGKSGTHDEGTLILTKDCKFFSSEDLLRRFNNLNCPLLKGKPKIFFFQFCRGIKNDIGHRVPPIVFQSGRTVTDDGNPLPTSPIEIERSYNDMLITYATLPGYVSYRNKSEGTWFIKALSLTFMRDAHECHIDRLLQIVDEQIHHWTARTAKIENGKQTLEIIKRGFNRKFYFNPGLWNMRDAERAAHIVLRVSKKISVTKGIDLYQLPIKRQHREAHQAQGVRHYVFGEPSYLALVGKRRQRTILMLGATGSGKSTLINAMVNYVLGVEWNDDFRFKLIDEPADKSQAHSQTDLVTTYNLYEMKGSRLNYSLTVVDTPGFGGTRGLEKDKKIMQQIQDYFKCRHRIQQLEAVCFVVQSSLSRLTATQKYIFDSILSIFGQDIKDNIRLMVTFSDGALPPVLGAVKEAGIPSPMDPSTGLPLHHKFNNSIFFTSNKGDRQTNEFNRTYFDMAVGGFDKFFDDLGVMEAKSLTLTRHVLEERKRLEALVEGLQMKTEMKLSRVDELEKIKKILKENEEQMDANQAFEFETLVPKSTDISGTGQFTTNCQNCRTTCHFPCREAHDNDKHLCSVMDRISGSCMICKCPWNVHFNQKYRYEMVKEKVKRSSDAIRQQCQGAVSEALTNEQLLARIEKEIKKHESQLMELMQATYPCIQRLDEIALRPHPFSAPDYIDLMIAAEKQEHRPGYQQRIATLQKLR